MAIEESGGWSLDGERYWYLKYGQDFQIGGAILSFLGAILIYFDA